MARFHKVIDVLSGVVTDVPYTAQEEIDADAQKASDDLAQAPIIADQQRATAIKANARRQVIANAYQTSDDAQLIAKVAARYPTLTGDALKAVTDLHLMMAGVIRA